MRRDVFAVIDKDGKKHEFVVKSKQDFSPVFKAYKAGIKKK